MKCSNCNQEITGKVYHVKGIIHRCCTLGCLAHLMLNVLVTPVKEMERQDKEDYS